MEAREGDHVDGQLSQICVELAGEAQARGHSRHCQGDKMVKVSIGGVGQPESAEADVIESLIVNTVGLVSVLNELVNRQGCIVGLDDSVRHLGGGDDRVGVHDPVGVLLTDLRDEEGSHAGASATSKRVSKLESLEAVTRLSFFTNNIQN